MKTWILNNWQFLLGDIIIPIVTFVIGLFLGKAVERRKASSRIDGSDNIIIQNSDFSDTKQKGEKKKD